LAALIFVLVIKEIGCNAYLVISARAFAMAWFYKDSKVWAFRFATVW